uniref:Uncharacterized protein n=1 Tax=viral metagenome TaxID=1070528 RepID=A0A6M3IR41_9ZZZZ
MSILDTNTPLKIKHIVIVVLLAGMIYFGYTMYRQVKINTANIQTIASFLQQSQQAKVEPKPAPKE